MLISGFSKSAVGRDSEESQQTHVHNRASACAFNLTAADWPIVRGLNHVDWVESCQSACVKPLFLEASNPAQTGITNVYNVWKGIIYLFLVVCKRLLQSIFQHVSCFVYQCFKLLSRYA